jgi:hypothetical protein
LNNFKVEISKDLYDISNNMKNTTSPLKLAGRRYDFWQRVYIAKEAIEKQLKDRYGKRSILVSK